MGDPTDPAGAGHGSAGPRAAKDLARLRRQYPLWHIRHASADRPGALGYAASKDGVVLTAPNLVRLADRLAGADRAPRAVLITGPPGWNSGPCLPAAPAAPAVTAQLDPFETEAEARGTPQVRAVWAAGFDRAGAASARMITEACDAAGVDLGAWDRKIVAWLSGFEPTTVAVIAGMITRAAAGRDAAP